MPKSVLDFPDASAIAPTADQLYVLQGTGLDRDRKVTPKVLVQAAVGPAVAALTTVAPSVSDWVLRVNAGGTAIKDTALNLSKATFAPTILAQTGATPDGAFTIPAVDTGTGLGKQISLQELSMRTVRVAIPRTGAQSFRWDGLTASGSLTDSYDVNLGTTKIPSFMEYSRELGASVVSVGCSFVAAIRASTIVSSTRDVSLFMTDSATDTTVAAVAALLQAATGYGAGTAMGGSWCTAALHDAPGFRYMTMMVRLFVGSGGQLDFSVYSPVTFARYTYAELLADFGSSASTSIVLNIDFRQLLST